ncbi:MAG: hypothetical protein Q7P63_11985 [Verrucomicrobiota bacterium JB022]|nr:hypothetical protein [Verrucomicrobiota bacterium JB022]
MQLVTNKKPIYPVGAGLRDYLQQYGRTFKLPVSYSRLTEWEEAMPLYDHMMRDTLWRTVIYRPEVWKRLNKHLTAMYAMLKTEGDMSFVEQLYVDRVDYCVFGNSNPFRIRVVNAYNDNQDYYYIKRADASRIYGLELEHLLTPNRMHYLVAEDVLVEEHVVGIPGDVFINRWMADHHIKKIRLAKELVKFNERCFVRLLGDMRSYNFVFDVTPDFEEVQIRIRAMDFDQQSYSGRLNFYRPQFFKDNNPLVAFCTNVLNVQTARQYQREEQAVIYRRIGLAHERVSRLIRCMRQDELSAPEKVAELKNALADLHQNRKFLQCERMGDILRESLLQVETSVRKHRLERNEPLSPVAL